MKRPQMLAGAAALGLAVLTAPSAACTVTMGGMAYPSIQVAVNVAPMIATIGVDGSTGVCNENVLIPNVTLRMILSGTNGAAIVGVAGAPTVDVRVKGFMLQGFTVSGGSRGIQLQRNANAILDSVTVQNTGGEGIVIDSMAFGVVTNSMIRNNPGPGIKVAELASARIGANLPEDGGAIAPNTIANNGADGVLVTSKATAQIVHNTISGNAGNGISVTASSSASTAGNTIDGNTVAGVNASERSYLSLGILGGTTEIPDTTAVNNGQSGVSCTSGAVVSGFLFSSAGLTGNTSQFGPANNAFDPSCPRPAANLTLTDSTGRALASCPNGAGAPLSVCISPANGIPRLIINGVSTPPLVFFGNLQEPQSQWPLVASEIRLAAANGVHLYKVATNIPWTGTDYSWVDPLVAFYVNADPNAMVILQLEAAVVDELGTFAVPPGNDYLYADGTTSPMSKASDLYFNGYQTAVVNAINHFESGPYAGHVIAYWISADGSGEWFDPNYRVKGPDYSPVNVAAFRQWLTKKYGTNAALAAAWGQLVTLATAAVPVASAGRFPMGGVTAGQQLNAFYAPASQQNWVDYSTYVSDLNTSRVLQIAQAAKQAMQGRKLVGLYYGYTFDLPGSFGGQQNIFPILNSATVDILAAPISYAAAPGTNMNGTDRLAGGSGGAMSALDSIALHGKLWFNEDDLWTWLAANSGIPPNLPAPNTPTNPPTQGFSDTNGILQRDFASILVHRAGTWWMDLNADGAFNDPNLWAIMSQYGFPLYNDVYSQPVPLAPDVTVLVDETSVFYQQNDWDFLYRSRALLRNAIVKTGTTVGFYYLADFISGASPPSKAYVFANSGYLTDSEVTAIRARLGKEGATAIWQHAPGFLGGSRAGASGSGAVTGMMMTEMDGPDYSIGVNILAGLDFGYGGTQNTLVPRLVVNDPAATTFGTWAVGDGVSAAMKSTGGFTSIILGGFALGNPDLLRKLLAQAGAHIWLSTDDVFMCDGRHLVVHAASAGTKTVSLPPPRVDASTGLNTITVTMQLGETAFFNLK